MKVDRFTKIVLTVIAVNLTILSLQKLNLVPIAYANDSTNNTEFNRVDNYGLVPLNEDGSIKVSLSSDEIIDVRLRGIDRYWSCSWESIPVKMEE